MRPLAIDRAELVPEWLDDTSFWYRVTTGAGEEIIRVDCETGAKERLPEPPAREQARAEGATEIAFVNESEGRVELWWLRPGGARKSYGHLERGGERRQPTYAGHRWLAADADGAELAKCEAGRAPSRCVIGAGPGVAAPTVSAPDGSVQVGIVDHDVYIVGPTRLRLSQDGSEGDPYIGRFHFSPDGKKLVAWRRQRPEPARLYRVESPPPAGRPRLHASDYLRPGDRIARERPRLFDVAARRPIAIDDELFANPWDISHLRWARDSRRFTFVYNQRGHQLLRLVAVDAATGAASTLIEERSDTFVDYAHKLFLRWLDDSGELLWMSERDGWNHLYLCDAATGAIRRQLTRGAFAVRAVEHVDVERRCVWLLAGGVRAGEDPYHVHLCRVGLDGGEVELLTEGDGTHAIAFSPGRRFFVDSWSRVDQPPIHELRRAGDGSLVCELERADLTALLAAGADGPWSLPERFVAPGRDGASDIHGVILKPPRFDPAARYPVVEEIYAGPQDQHVPKAFGLMPRQQELARRGFVVVQIDAMGTNWRSKAFHDVAWQNLEDAGFADRKAWLAAAARARPYMDLDRVGIYGGSAGGQSAVRALIDHGDLYKVAVADCGCHDNRLDKIWWNELWLGWPVGEAYERASNVVAAARLSGKLMLIVGELDDNVDPASTLQLAGALQRADKDFELVVVIGAGHGAAETPYGSRRRLEFLARHLLG